MATAQTPEFWSDVPPVPDVPSGRADLYLRFPSKGTAEKVRDALRQAGQQVQLLSNELVFCIPNVELTAPLRTIAAALSPVEAKETLALPRPVGSALDPVDLLLAMRLNDLRGRLTAGWLVDLLRSRNLRIVFQPIYRASDRTSAYGYEALMRGTKYGADVLPPEMIQTAKRAQLLGQLDELAMQTTLAQAASSKISTAIFINSMPSHMFDPAARVSEMAALCDRLGLQPAQIVFEVVESERIEPSHVKSFVRACRIQRFRVALDDLGAGYSTVGLLSDVRPDLVKIDRSLITAINADPFRAVILNHALDATRVLGIPTVVEGIESESELMWACANGATYVQGNLLGEPAALASN